MAGMRLVWLALRRGGAFLALYFALCAAAGRAGAQETLPVPRPVEAAGPPAWLPRYDVAMRIDVAGHVVHVHQRATWTNRHRRPAHEVVFNAHSHYKPPDDQIGFLAKMLEILRMTPSDVLDGGDPPLHIDRVACDGVECAFRFEGDTDTTLAVPLPVGVAVGEGQSVVLDLEFSLRLPQKQGRWGQWEGVTFLSNWLPVLAVYDECGWQPTPFVPWHQPFFNEAGFYTVRAVLPCGQNIACTGGVQSGRDLGNGWRQVEINPCCVRDFAFLCSARYREFCGQAGPVKLHVLAFPEHEHYAQAMLRHAATAIEAYSRWFGPYPYADFSIAEAYFGWNGNECATLVMIDERVFGMPHVAEGYVEYLISHEVCHQWWYNVVGTNGYCETWMDEAPATYFSHRLLNQLHGKNNDLLTYPNGLGWMPNISRDTYRSYALYGTIGRGEACKTVQKMEDFGHLVNLFSICYDKGSRIVGMIEDRLGEGAFLDFMRTVYRRYQYRILRVKDFQKELEEYTGRSWDEFFQRWLYGKGLTDWAVEKVTIEDLSPRAAATRSGTPPGEEDGPACPCKCTHKKRRPCKVTILLHQKAEYNEDTVVGICLDDGLPHCKCRVEGCPYQVRIPVVPDAGALDFDSPPSHVEPLPDNRVRITVDLPCRPRQIAVDPDQVLVDKDPSNNYWKPPVRWRIAPLYTFLEETDLTNAYDRWNVLAGPWIFGTTYEDPWYTRSTMIGFRAGLYRTQEFSGGAYAAYRTDFRDVVAGVDGLWDHWPWAHTQIGFNAEERLVTFYEDANQNAARASAFARYVIGYGDSLYLPPMHYIEAFSAYQQNFLPEPRQTVPGGQRFDQTATAGLHYHINYLTPYWDPEGGFAIDATYTGGLADLDSLQGLHQLTGQVSYLKSMPDLDGWLDENSRLGRWLKPPLHWLSDTRWAMRAYGAVGLPTQAEYFPLGGSELLRGFDLAQRQGSLVWVASLEWRVPLAKHLTCDCVDHSIGLRNVYGAAFYDVGDAYIRNRSAGPVAHSVGVGLRLDVAWFSFVERTSLRFDVAKTVNADTPVQFWFGIKQPF